MNLVGHVEVATRCGLDRTGQLGAILPDLASMLRARIDHAALPASMAGGVRMHHTTDAVFHGHPEVRGSMAALGATLTQRGVARGAARSVAHVGYELLLDAAADDRLAAVLGDADDALVAAALPGGDRWPELRDHFMSRQAHHDDPRWVAERLYGVLRHRPRLAFPVEQLPEVAASLAAHADHIHAMAPGVFSAVVGQVISR